MTVGLLCWQAHGEKSATKITIKGKKKEYRERKRVKKEAAG